MKKHLTTILILLSAALFVLLLPRLDLAKVTAAETTPLGEARALPPGESPDSSEEDLPAPEFKNQKCGPNLTATLKNGVLTITGNGPMEEPYPWADERSRIAVNTVNLPQGLTNIGAVAFRCPNLRSITIPNTVTTIEKSAFVNAGLEKADLPVSVTKIESGAFDGCKALKELVVRNPNCQVRTESWWVEDEDSHEELIVGRTLGYADRTRIFGKHVAGLENGSLSADYNSVEAFANLVGYDFYPIGVFPDVAEGKFYELPVAWAAGEGITTGTSAGLFEPDADCTRGQVVTFLWRASGCPEPVRTNARQFTDVNTKAYYYKALLWALDAGITNGTTPSTFEPNKTCTRGEVVTFLWRTKGKPLPRTDSSAFMDANPKAYYYQAMLWAVGNKITTGTTAATFSPNGICSRGQVVTFLYRADSVPASYNNLGTQFLLYAEDVYNVTGRGPVVTGRVVNGKVKVGDSIYIYTRDRQTPIYTRVEAIEMFHKILDEAEKGDNVGILLGSNVTASQIQRGAALVSSSSNLGSCANATIIGTLNLNGTAGAGIEEDGAYQFHDGVTDYTGTFWSVHGSSPIPMGEIRDRVMIKTTYPVVWYPGQVLTVRRGGWTYGEFTILEIRKS